MKLTNKIIHCYTFKLIYLMDNPYVLFEPEEKIYWICCYDSNNKSYLAAYITKRFDDLRIIKKDTIEQCSKYCLFWKQELELNNWIQLENKSKYILKMIKNKHINEAMKVRKNYSYELLSYTRRQKIYNKYKIKKSCCTTF